MDQNATGRRQRKQTLPIAILDPSTVIPIDPYTGRRIFRHFPPLPPETIRQIYETKEPKARFIDKLRNLKTDRAFRPDAQDSPYQFLEFLASRLESNHFNSSAKNDTITALAFMIEAYKALRAFQKGFDERTGQPIAGPLASESSHVYQLLADFLPTIAEKIGSEAFANAVKIIHNRIESRSSEIFESESIHGEIFGTDHDGEIELIYAD